MRREWRKFGGRVRLHIHSRWSHADEPIGTHLMADGTVTCQCQERLRVKSTERADCECGRSYCVSWATDASFYDPIVLVKDKKGDNGMAILSWACPECRHLHMTSDERMEIYGGVRYVHCGHCGHDWALPVPMIPQQVTTQFSHAPNNAGNCGTCAHDDPSLHLCAHRNGRHQAYDCKHWVPRVHIADGEYILRETALKEIDDLKAQLQSEGRLADAVRGMPEGYGLHHNSEEEWSICKADAMQGKWLSHADTPGKALTKAQGKYAEQETADNSAAEVHECAADNSVAQALADKKLADAVRGMAEGAALHRVMGWKWKVANIRGQVTREFNTPEEALSTYECVVDTSVAQGQADNRLAGSW